MSHVVTIKTEVRDAAAVRAACRSLSLAEPIQGKTKFFSGEVEGSGCATAGMGLSRSLRPESRPAPLRQLCAAVGATRNIWTAFFKPTPSRKPSWKPEEKVTWLRRLLLLRWVDQADYPGHRRISMKRSRSSSPRRARARSRRKASGNILSGSQPVP